MRVNAANCYLYTLKFLSKVSVFVCFIVNCDTICIFSQYILAAKVSKREIITEFLMQCIDIDTYSDSQILSLTRDLVAFSFQLVYLSKYCCPLLF